MYLTLICAYVRFCHLKVPLTSQKSFDDPITLLRFFFWCTTSVTNSHFYYLWLAITSKFKFKELFKNRNQTVINSWFHIPNFLSFHVHWNLNFVTVCIIQRHIDCNTSIKKIISIIQTSAFLKSIETSSSTLTLLAAATCKIHRDLVKLLIAKWQSWMKKWKNLKKCSGGIRQGKSITLVQGAVYAKTCHGDKHDHQGTCQSHQCQCTDYSPGLASPLNE